VTRKLLLVLVSAIAAFPQGRGGRGGATDQPPAASATTGAVFVRENYSKFEYRIPMRDGKKMGPWNRGGFARGNGDRLGNVTFGSNTGQYYHEKIKFPFFLYYLKGRGDGKFPKAYVFQTGLNEWRKFETWPPKESAASTMFLDAKGKLSWTQPSAAAFDEYVADPGKPVPYLGRVIPTTVLNTYMTEDQRRSTFISGARMDRRSSFGWFNRLSL
jgi:predicted acyl esterase